MRLKVAMSAACCCASGPDPRRGDAACRRLLSIMLAVDAVMFVVEVGAGLAAGSASLQADALDFLGDAGDCVISLGVLRYGVALPGDGRARKGLAMGASASRWSALWYGTQ